MRRWGSTKTCVGRGRFASVYELDEHFCGVLADSKSLLLNCAQRHLQILAVVMAADADQAELLRGSQTAIQRCLMAPIAIGSLAAKDGICR